MPAPVVGAVVAAFRPGTELRTGVEAVLGQVASVVVVVDEHPVGEDTRVVLEACRAAGAEVVEHPANLGIGAALNTGVTRLRELLPELTDVLTLDQDSAVPEGYVPALLAAGAHARAAGVRVGMVAPDSVGSIVRLPGRRTIPSASNRFRARDSRDTRRRNSGPQFRSAWSAGSRGRSGSR